MLASVFHPFDRYKLKKTQLAADDDKTKPPALVLRPHFLCVVPMPEVCIDHTNDAVERHPSLLLTQCCGCPAQAIGVIMLAAGNAHRSGGGENYLAPPRNARIWSMRSTTQARSCAFSASSRSSGL